MKYDIQKYLDQARTVYANLANTQDLFCGCNSYWKVGNVFDTMTDFLLVSDDSPGTIAADVYRIYKDLKGACWYDDYAWWGLASSKASDPQYDTIFGASKTDFQNLANETWTFMNKGKGGDPISANLFVANLTQILYKYGACLEAMQPTRTGIYCYRFFHRIG